MSQESLRRQESAAEPAHHILADSSLTDQRLPVLKAGDTFALFDQYGDLTPSTNGEQGLYYEGTRFLSRLSLRIDGKRPFLLSSIVRDDNDHLTVTLTNPDLRREGSVYLSMGSLHIGRRVFLSDGALYQQIRVENYGLRRIHATLAVHVAADFADIYEVRGLTREARGEDLQPEILPDRVTLEYRGLDLETRRTRLCFSPPPDHLCSDYARFQMELAPEDAMTVYVTAGCERGDEERALAPFDDARISSESDPDDSLGDCGVESVNGQFNALANRAWSDLRMMITRLPTGPYPYAGLPWFNAPFGRDGIITALECLWFYPALARGVLAWLASTQATELNATQDAEPGKILHETRSGEMAKLGEMPFARYYGTVDATPLFVVLAGAYLERTNDLRLIETLWPNIDAALLWMDRYGDHDGDGFLEYDRQSGNGLLHQGWKDSDDCVFHADGSPARGPIAVCEVQAYAYAAWRAAATIATALNRSTPAEEFVSRAVALRVRFDKAFWCEELSIYGLALDGDKRLCRVRTSNAGQCLFSGIAPPDRANRVAQTLLDSEFFSGWGVRCVAASERRYNPMGYHTGCVWPHDSALIAWGFSRYGLTEEAVRIFTGLFDAGMYFDLHRMPELFCGFPRDPGEGPVLYPVACAPQAWSAGSVFLLLQACLGLKLSGGKPQVSFIRPALPPFLSELRILNMQVGDATVDLLLTRHRHGVGVDVLRRNGDVEIVVVM